MKPVVRVGDPLRPYGGEVLEGRYLAFGKPLAYLGARARCNKHGMTRIGQGASLSTLGGQAVALDGHLCECGCTVVSTLPLTSMSVAP
ncbi:PAAR domain-containing protein [Pseudomonas sp. RW407]|uniref:PAAR domain-containing protein n=1 Tax=Pseudomonas sp. RW407 TaxID=2202894 RepID=UPI000D6FDC00|nr:PAAR domain-containing protein [Pseudomonas sp. RW407]PWU29043.1 PAAR domain-containing protein [Pseudomonas sp. RW407]